MGSGDGVEGRVPGRSFRRARSQRRTATAPPGNSADAAEQVARYLRRCCGSGVELLVDRLPGVDGEKDGAIDVLAVTPNGVHVVDVQRSGGAAVRVHRHGDWALTGADRLVAGDQDLTELLGPVERHHDAVRRLLDWFPGGEAVPVHAAFCFVDADLPLFAERIGGIAVLDPRRVARRMSRSGPLDPEVRGALLRHLDRHLPPA